MISDVKSAFEQNLPNLNWMDKKTRKAALEKVSCMVLDVLFGSTVDKIRTVTLC